MREIKIQEMFQVLDGYSGKKVEVGTNPIWSVNTHQSFRYADKDSVLVFSDGDYSGRQEILIDKDQITEIMLSEGKDIYGSVVSIELINGKIDLCISENPTKCRLCHNIIDLPYETKWSIQGRGNYGSKFEDEKLDIPICDSCLYYNILGYKDGQFDE